MSSIFDAVGRADAVEKQVWNELHDIYLTSSIVMYNFGVGPRFAYVSASARAPK